jgi:membrane-bound lytic murein transglycosylase D
MSFLPPSPAAPAAAIEETEPPRVTTIQPDREFLASFRPALDFPPRPTAADPYLRRADSHYQSGKRLYQGGDISGARKEFDHAIDILLDAPEDNSDRLLLEKKYDKLVESIYRMDVESLGSGDNLQEPVFDKAPLEAILELTFPINPRIKNKVKEEVLGTTSQLPLQENDAVLSYINFFSSERGRRILESGLRRSGRYRDMISRILAEEGVPQELIFLAQAESGFLPRAVSRKAAVGMWQFIRSRGREYGLMQTGDADDRLDPEKATRAAARHLKDLYQQLGDWYLAIAGYNCGPGGVTRGVQKTGYADFWELRSRNALPKETANYVPIILAMTIMVKNAGDYGLDLTDFDPPIEYETIEMQAPTNLTLIADAAEKAVTEIRELNPALLRSIAPRGYEVRVPKGTAETALAALQQVPEQHRASWRLHRVEGDDTLVSIAKRYSTSAALISSANQDSSNLTPGSTLLIPAAFRDPGTVKKTVAWAHKPLRNSKSAAKTRSKPAVRRGAEVASLR